MNTPPSNGTGGAPGATRRSVLRSGVALAGAGLAAHGTAVESAAAAHGDAWPMQRFDYGNTGYHPGGNDPTSLVLLTELQEFSPVIGEDYLFADGAVYVHDGETAEVTAVDLETGERRWTNSPTDARFIPEFVEGPLLVGRTIGGRLFALNRESGEVTVEVDDAAVRVDFAGTADQVAGNVNAPLTVARSAVYFVIRCITDPEIPPNHGCYEPVTVTAPEGSLLNPEPPAAVVGGNVETSQRVTDVVFAALAEAAPERVPAGGQGTMNNLVVGSAEFAYYETVGGGAGATAGADGLSGVQVGMTNTLNTPVEALEAAYPLRVERYALRTGSGGAGEHRGGDGLVRSVTVDVPATVSLLTERRRHPPRGLAGGADGATGRNRIDGESVGPKVTRDVPPGTTVTVETPGGGGHGEPVDGEHGEPVDGEHREPADDSEYGDLSDRDGTNDGSDETATGDDNR